jgi:hypothetical protein
MYAAIIRRQPVSIVPLPGEIQTSASTASHQSAALCTIPNILLAGITASWSRHSLCPLSVLLLLFIAFPLYIVRACVLYFRYTSLHGQQEKPVVSYIQETTGCKDPRGTTLVDTLYVRKRAGTPTLSLWPTPDVDSYAPDYGG